LSDRRTSPAPSPDKAALAEPREVASHACDAFETEGFDRFAANVFDKPVLPNRSRRLGFIADCIWLAVPQPTEWQGLGD